MTVRTPLTADWKLLQVEPGVSLGFGTSTSITPPERRWMPAQVPGDVHLDLMRAGIIDDPFVGRGTDHCRWVAENDWVYEATVHEPVHTAGQRVVLEFAGLDTFATVFLDDEVIATHQNMFRPLSVDVTSHMNGEPHVLRVRLDSAMTPRGRDLSQADVFGYGPRRRMHSRKSQMYAFHTAAWLMTIGIWKPVTWLVHNELSIDDVFPRTVAINPDGSATVEVTVDIAKTGSLVLPATLSLTVAGEHRVVSVDTSWNGAHIRETFEVENAKLWWVHDHGAQDLYEWKASLTRDGSTLDERTGTFGIRTVRVAEEPDHDGGTSFRVELNGKPIFLKGFNWVPLDSILARGDDEKRYEELLGIAREANANAIRVNGFGIYERDVFYDLCDRLGILVAQDFMFADAAYPHDAEFLHECRLEAVHQVRRLRAHPSLGWWFGDNENDHVVPTQLGFVEYVDNELNKSVLAEAVQLHAPGTPYFPSSPYSPMNPDANSDREGTCHIWRFGVRWDDPAYTELRPRMMIEIGLFGLPPREVMESMLGPNVERWPVYNDTYFARLDDSRNSRDAWYDILFDTIRAAGLEQPESLDELIERTQLLQAEATSFWIDHYSAQDTCWGIFLWSLNDPWPCPSCSYLAYPAVPKPALAAAREAFGRISR